MINIYLNSKKIVLEKKLSLQQVLEMNEVVTGSFAIAINKQFIPRGQYALTSLNDGDEIQIVFPMQGG